MILNISVNVGCGSGSIVHVASAVATAVDAAIGTVDRGPAGGFFRFIGNEVVGVYHMAETHNSKDQGDEHNADKSKFDQCGSGLGSANARPSMCSERLENQRRWSHRLASHPMVFTRMLADLDTVMEAGIQG
jgi:hypothetical protein